MTTLKEHEAETLAKSEARQAVADRRVESQKTATELVEERADPITKEAFRAFAHAVTAERQWLIQHQAEMGNKQRPVLQEVKDAVAAAAQAQASLKAVDDRNIRLVADVKAIRVHVLVTGRVGVVAALHHALIAVTTLLDVQDDDDGDDGGEDASA